MSEREFEKLKGGAPKRARKRTHLVRSEHDEQVAIIDWANANIHRCPELALLHAIPNGGSRAARVDKHGNRYSLEAKRLLDEGVKNGYPDLGLDVARRGFHGLRIELKAEGGKASPEQLWWLAELGKQGYCAVVKFGADAAIAMIRWYLGG